MSSQAAKLNEMWTTGQGRNPGDVASAVLAAGNVAQAMSAARSIIESGDPYAIKSLNGFMFHVFDRKNLAKPDIVVRPDIRSLAFSVAACQLGLACGPLSLQALQMCATVGQCNGDVVERLLGSLPERAERLALLREGRRLADAIRAENYSTLGMEVEVE
jgi:hypothetical protein